MINKLVGNKRPYLTLAFVVCFIRNFDMLSVTCSVSILGVSMLNEYSRCERAQCAMLSASILNVSVLGVIGDFYACIVLRYL